MDTRSAPDVSPAPAPTSRRANLLVWLLCWVVAALTLLAYISASLAAGRGTLLLPLDDVYIHFQYARQLAQGQSYIYNPGDPPTSGATSFIYPYVLAAGYLSGFHDLALGAWALGVGALALAGSMWLVYLLVRARAGPLWLGAGAACAFGLTGSSAWHFMSGMETGLLVFFTLFTLYAVVTTRLRLFAAAATLLALARPEAAAPVIIAVGVMLLRPRIPANGGFARVALWLLLPLVACFLQPALNLAFTGSATASGSAAKSLLGLIPQDWGVIIARIVENFVRMWAEWLTGYSPREGWYLPVLLFPLGLVGLAALVRQRAWGIATLLTLWLLALSGAVSTLDTAFWHFKRYQTPALALMFPLAAWALAWGWQALCRTRFAVLIPGAGAALLGFALLIGAQFLGYYHTNVGYVYAQPYQMALWLRANTAEDALVAVHDVGLMRYLGGRSTLDMVGLTTPGAAAYWRNGPGSVAEFLIDQQPDYIASYGEGHGYGLGMLAQTSLYANERARFEVVLDDRVNVALAASVQGIYEPAWEEFWDDRDLVGGDYITYTLSQRRLVTSIYVGDIASEHEHNYQVVNSGTGGRFPSEPFEIRYSYFDLMVGLNVTVPLLDGVRIVRGYEQFDFTLPATDHDVVLVTRVHSAASGTLAVYLNDEFLDRNVVPERPGSWLDVYTAIPRDRLRPHNTIRIVPEGEESFYFPASHAIFSGELYVPVPTDSSASFQDDAVLLHHAFLQPNFGNPTSRFDGLLWVQLSWYFDTRAYGDYRLFIHVYDDINQPPLQGLDVYLGNGQLPLGNVLPSYIGETRTLDLRAFESGTYRVAIGFYNPYTQERLMPTSSVYDVSPDGRLWLGEIEVP